MRILLVEDNDALATWLHKLLRGAHLEVDVARDGEEADIMTRDGSYQTILLDLGLPKHSGLEVLRRLRSRRDPVPVIVLTANDSLATRITSLDAGADDYLAKPFDSEELEARIRVQVRRAHRRVTSEISCGSLKFDLRTHDFQLAEQPLSLTPRERSVLKFLLLNSNEPVSKNKIWHNIFNLETEVDPSAVEIYVHRLRRKLDGTDINIRTLRGLGYMLYCEPAGRTNHRE